MGAMHTNCRLGSDLNQLPSSHIPVKAPGPTIGVLCLKIAMKHNFWPDFMGFKAIFNGFYICHAYKLWFRQ